MFPWRSETVPQVFCDISRSKELSLLLHWPSRNVAVTAYPCFELTSIQQFAFRRLMRIAL